MPERPIECSHCKKGVKVIYKEAVGDMIIRTEMCEDCPVLMQKLYGASTSPVAGASGAKVEGLSCGDCGNTLESVKMGNPMGCSNCYTVFADTIIFELAKTDAIPPKIKKNLEGSKKPPVHLNMGKSPAAALEISPSSKITALNEALNEALKRENYEEAARLRDQIKALMEKQS